MLKKFFKKFSSYSFWISLSGAVIILLNSLGRAFGFSVDNEVVDDCIMAIAGVLVVLGVVTGIGKKDGTNDDLTDENDDEENEIKNE